MEKLKSITDSRVNETFANYPDLGRYKMQFLRELVIETAEEMQDVNVLKETLKWGESSFVTKHGSKLRMDWKEKSPNQYAMKTQLS